MARKRAAGLQAVARPLRERDAMAAAYGVGERTLRNWAKIDLTRPRRRGRPPHGPERVEQARGLVRAELDRMGWSAGESTLVHVLGSRVPRRLLRRVLRELKAERAVRRREHIEQARVSVAVHARDALWTLDATHLGRDRRGASVEAEVVCDVASSRILWAGVGTPSTAKDVIELLEELRRLRGGLPLVLLTDNGPAYTSELVEQYLERHQVVHLLNLPRTPQHNPWGEGANGKLKAETELGKGVRLHGHDEARHRIEPALGRLNDERPRASRGWRTPAQADAETPTWRARVGRTEFWERTRCAVNAAVVGCEGNRALRRARREAQLATLECFGLITRTRGDAQAEPSMLES